MRRRLTLAAVLAATVCWLPATASAHDVGAGAHAREHAREDRALLSLARRWRALPPGRRRAERRRAGAVALRAMQESVDAPADEIGRWGRAEDRIPLPLYAINSVVLPTGKVLMWGRPPVDPDTGTRANTTPASLWDPAHPDAPPQDVTPQLDLDGDGDLENAPVFCSGQSLLPDGRVLAAGGTLAYPDAAAGTSFKGLDLLFLFDPWTERWSIAGRMRHGRWYPSQVELADGRIAIMAGLDETGSAADNRDLELFDWRDGSITHVPAGDALPSTFARFTVYPHLFAMPGGDVVLGGADAVQSGLLDTGALAAGGAAGSAWTVIEGGSRRGFGMGVHLPGAPTRAALVGGYGEDSTARRDSAVIDTAAATPRWAASPEVPPLNVARSNGNVVILPDGSLAAIGGGAGSSSPGLTAGGDPTTDPGTENAYTGRDQQLKRVELLRPGADDGWRLGPAQAKWRTYHSTATLLPDGRVLSAGDDYWDVGDLPDPWATSGGAADEAEIYSPPYLFDHNEPAPRPVIADAPGRGRYGDVARLRISAGDAERAVLVAPAAVTHAADMNQRHVELEIARAAGDAVLVRLPGDPTLAPPGYYMLFVLDAAGTPSSARWIQLAAPDAPAPAAPATEAAPGPSPPSRARDVTAPRLRAWWLRSPRDRRAVRMRLRVSERARVTAVLSVRGHRLRSVLSVRAGRTRTVTVRLPKAVTRRIRGGRRTVASLRLIAEDAAGNRSRLQRSRRLR